MNIFEYLDTTEEHMQKISSYKDEYYLSFPIKKSSGKLRWIDAPQTELKELQYKILYRLLYLLRPHKAAVGFIRNTNVIDGAKRHLGSKVLLNMDIKDFFPSIAFEPDVMVMLDTVAKKLIQRKNVKTNKKSLQLIADLLTFKGALPQGSPASPAAANISCYKMDTDITDSLKHLELNLGCKFVYTRYADDITVSCNKKSIDMKDIHDKIKILLSDNGFQVNTKKTRIQRPHRRMSVTGVVINDKIGAPKWKRRLLRAKIHTLQKNDSAITPLQEQQLRGQVGWIQQLQPHHGNKLMKSLGKISIKNF